MLINAQSLKKGSKCDSLKFYCLNENIDIVVIGETWANDNLNSAELTLGGVYNVFRRDRKGRGGGVCILAKPNLGSCEVAILDQSVEAVAIDIFAGTERQTRIICVYFSPTGSHSALSVRMENLCKTLKRLCLVLTPIVLAGDLNLPAVDWKVPFLPSNERSKEYIFLKFCLLNSLVQLVDKPTRPRSNNILDLVLTNQEEFVCSVSPTNSPIDSDHHAIRFGLVLPVTTIAEKSRYNFYRADFEGMAATLACTNWETFFESCSSADEQYTKLVELLTFLIETHTPLSSTTTSSLESYIKRVTRQLQVISSSDPTYSTLSKKLKRATQRERKINESSLNIIDAKSFFRYANQRLNIRSGVAPLKDGDNLAVTDLRKASLLRDHFVSQFVPSDSHSPNVTLQSPIRIDDVTFSTQLIYKKLSSIDRKTNLTPDNIPPIIFKELADVLSEPLAIIFTRSFEEGEVPELFKQSIVTPVFKKGSRGLPQNYRPVAQESMFCIIMESIIVDAINDYVSSTGLLDPNQHGFTRGKSTATQLLEVSHDWALAKNHRNPLHCIYFDFSCAFDRVDHRILISKMTALGIGSRITKWCASYLSDRKFSVKVGNSFSPPADAPSGVPQGSCLGPLLYSIFSQDMKLLFEGLPVKYMVYADDLKLYCEITSDKDRVALQSAIDLVSMWASVNKMTISLPKCALIKTMHDDTIYLLNNVPIRTVTSYRDLGVIFDADFKFREHIIEGAKSASRLCNMILRTFIIQNPAFYIKLYNTIVVPKWTYCAQVWSPFYLRDVGLLQRVQNRFLKRVAFRCNVPRNALSLPSVQEVQQTNDLRVLKKLITNNMFTYYFDVRQNNLRSGASIHPPEVATLDTVNNSFAWRMSRRIHADSDISNLLVM